MGRLAKQLHKHIFSFTGYVCLFAVKLSCMIDCNACSAVNFTGVNSTFVVPVQICIKSVYPCGSETL